MNSVTITRRVLAVVAAVLILATVYGVQMAAIRQARAEGTVFWVLCQPNDYINVRMTPSTRSDIVGRLETGDTIYFDGKTRNGFCHLNPAQLEVSEAWIYSGYVSEYEPRDMGGKTYRVTSEARVAARKCIEGERLRWMYDGDLVKVWYMTEEWAVTNRGFIRSEYLWPVG